jgi:hypothetical protein
MRLRPFVNYYQDNWSQLLPLMDHAAAILPHESTGVSPFLVDRGYEPRTSFDWKPVEETLPAQVRIDREAAIQRARQMEDVWEFAQRQMKKAQEQQKRQADKHRREIDFEVGDNVWLLLKDYHTGRPNKKLDNQMAGKFRIIERVGNSYRLELPPSMKIHPVFSPDKLRKAADNPLPGQLEDPGEPVEIDGQQEWEVEEVLASRFYRGKLRYRVKWVGYDEDPEWYPARNMKGSPHKIRDFHSQYPDQPGPPKRLTEWLRAWEDGEDLPDEPDDDKAI